MPLNPSASVKASTLVVRRGKTPVLWEEDLQDLFATFDIRHVVGLRDRAAISVMFFSFPRVGAVAKLRVKDYRSRGRHATLRFQEKGGVENDELVHPVCAQYLDEYIEASGISGQLDRPLFCSSVERTHRLTLNAMSRRDFHRMAKRRCREAALDREISCHFFRASGSTIFRKNGGKLETTRQMAYHLSARTRQLYDYHKDTVTFAEITRIRS